jgi:hypothetical protein
VRYCGGFLGLGGKAALFYDGLVQGTEGSLAMNVRKGRGVEVSAVARGLETAESTA